MRLKVVPYLLSLLTFEILEKESPQVLCYHINMTDEIQIVHVMNESNCYIECIVLPEEGILFAALPESHLEINSSRINGTVLEKIPCKLLNIHEKTKP
jgi:hypothetical protein